MAFYYAVVPIFYKQTALEQLGTLLFGGKPVAQEPMDVSYIGAICDDEATAERLIAAVQDEKAKWVGPIKRYQIVPLDCVYPRDTRGPLPEYLYLYRESIKENETPVLYTPESTEHIPLNLIEQGMVKVRKNVYYHEGLINASENYPYTAPYFNSSGVSNVASTSSIGTAKPEGLEAESSS